VIGQAQEGAGPRLTGIEPSSIIPIDTVHIPPGIA
jgi:hypothetical protein